MTVFLFQWLNEQQLVQKLVAMIDGSQTEEVGLSQETGLSVKRVGSL